MNRNLKHSYRGVSKRTNRLVYGDLVLDNDDPSIVYIVNLKYKGDSEMQPESFEMVDPESVQEATGIMDRNGKMIYEGDTVSWYEIVPVNPEEYFEEDPELKCIKKVGVVMFDDSFFGLKVKNPDGSFEVCGEMCWSCLHLEYSDNLSIDVCTNLTEEEKKLDIYYGYEIVKRR